jgi:protein-tyrosine phosphatase
MSHAVGGNAGGGDAAATTVGARRLLVLCTGNATRSVIATAALRAAVPGLDVEAGGTFSIEGRPVSWRTRAGLDAVGLAADGHRSRQAGPADIDTASLVIGLAPEHVEWVRRHHPGAAARTLTLKRLCRDLPGGTGTLEERIAALGLEHVAPEPWEEVVDPGGGEVDAFVACAHEIAELVGRLTPTLLACTAAGTDRRAGAAVPLGASDGLHLSA